jgi:hypothetical protein
VSASLRAALHGGTPPAPPPPWALATAWRSWAAQGFVGGAGRSAQGWRHRPATAASTTTGLLAGGGSSQHQAVCDTPIGVSLTGRANAGSTLQC